MAFLKFLAIENMLPHFSAHVYYGQTAGRIRIPLDTEVCLGLDVIVLDGYPLPPTERAQQPPTFRPTALAGIPAGPHFAHSPDSRLRSERRAALVAILPDNCHPSSYENR